MKRLFQGRWAPFVGLVAAALLYVALAIALIPEGEVSSHHHRPVTAPRRSAPARVGSGTLPTDRNASKTRPRAVKRARKAARAPMADIPEIRRRGFSPPRDRSPAPSNDAPSARSPTEMEADAAASTGSSAHPRAADLKASLLRGRPNLPKDMKKGLLKNVLTGIAAGVRRNQASDAGVSAEAADASSSKEAGSYEPQVEALTP